MNKLLVSDIINLNSGEYEIEVESSSLTIEVNGNVTIYLINQLLDNLVININDNSTLNVYKFNKNMENNIKVLIKQDNNSNICYNEAFINNKENKLTINNYLNGNNNKSIINIRNICNSNNSDVIINAFIKKDTLNNIALEDLKGINNGGFIHIEPNIICESNEVEANHLTTIGNLDQRLIDYLMSKGINEKKARNILLRGFIFSNMGEFIKEKIGGEIDA